MHVLKMSNGALEEDYGILCKTLFPRVDDDAEFGFVWAEVPAGEASTPHAHPEREAFVVAGGTGSLDAGGETTDVVAGDAVFIPAPVGSRCTTAFDAPTPRSSMPMNR